MTPVAALSLRLRWLSREAEPRRSLDRPLPAMRRASSSRSLMRAAWARHTDRLRGRAAAASATPAFSARDDVLRPRSGSVDLQLLARPCYQWRFCLGRVPLLSRGCRRAGAGRARLAGQAPGIAASSLPLHAGSKAGIGTTAYIVYWPRSLRAVAHGPMLRRDDAEYLHRKAAQFRALAVEANRSIADELRALADELDLFASEIETRPILVGGRGG